MRVLLIGSGGREHALAWAIAGSPRLAQLSVLPGNAGIARHAECIDLDSGDVEAVARHAVDSRYDLVVIGPEAPLVLGLADRLSELGIAVFGPGAAAARIEGSKVFAKRFMARHAIPTPAFRVFDDAARARDYLEAASTAFPLVVKADGLAAGKGVVICEERREAVRAASAMLEEGRFGAAGQRIVVEECLVGREASFFALTDGERFVELAPCQDYKRAQDGDGGPNTGGMGSYSPASFLDPALRREIVERVIEPTLRGLAAEGCPFRGVLYAGLMLTADGPEVLEFNARFGDPETQVLLPRLAGDWLELFAAAASGSLSGQTLAWKDEAAVCVVMTSGGYPDRYEQGRPISGLPEAEAAPGVLVFHAGTRRAGDQIVTAGGRVLGVTAQGKDLATARERAYAAVARIHFEGERHRSDIALDAVRVGAQGARP